MVVVNSTLGGISSYDFGFGLVMMNDAYLYYYYRVFLWSYPPFKLFVY